MPIPYLLTLLLMLCGCSRESTDVVTSATADTWLPLKIGTREIEVQIVLTRAEQAKGLMNRDTLPENSGMLFAYRVPTPMSFWMANTSIPLDIGFFDSTGLLVEVHRMVPFDTGRTQSRAQNLQYALEMNAGWFSGHGIYPGNRIDLKSLADALKARGVNPVAFGITE
jgi:uncharacterized membrane protein (UPF0127 family)